MMTVGFFRWQVIGRFHIFSRDYLKNVYLHLTGDTTFDLFLKSPPEDLLKVKLLITEATYIDQDRESIQKARDRGHTHLQELVDNAQLFDSVEKIILIHFSDKYSPKYIMDTVMKLLPPSLSDKVLVSPIAKEKQYNTINITGLLQS